MGKTIWSDGKAHCDDCGKLIDVDAELFMDGICEECWDEREMQDEED